MNPKTLERLAFGVSLIGILILIIVSDSMKTEMYTEINSSLLEKIVNVEGKVSNLIEMDEFFLFDLILKNDKVKVIGFKDGYLDIYENDFVIVNGKVIEYKGELEIEANVIKLQVT